MAYANQEQYSVNRWWRFVEISSNTNTTLLNDPPIDSTAGRSMRPVIEGWYIQVVQSTTDCNASIRSKTTTTTIAARVDQPGHATGDISVTSEMSGLFIPMTAGEGLIVNTAGITAGRVNVTCWGRWVPSVTPLADKYTGAP